MAATYRPRRLRPTPSQTPIVIDALNAAEGRGVAIRIVLDPRERHDFVKLGGLADDVRIKRGGPTAYGGDAREDNNSAGLVPKALTMNRSLPVSLRFNSLSTRNRAMVVTCSG